MLFLVWVAVGFVAAVVANKTFAKTTGGVAGDISVGIAGAVGAGALCGAFKMTGAPAINFYSSLIVGIGAIVPLIAYHVLFRDRGKRAHGRF